jgi:tetratricopeptide (TPR) repeat protein
MRDTIAWSYDLLPEWDRRLFRTLTVFPGGYDLRAVAAVTARDDVVDDLGRFVDASLVSVSPSGRFTMLQTVREYGLERLSAGGEESETLGNHVRYVLALSEEAEAGLTGKEESRWLSLLGDEYENLWSAIAWAQDCGEIGTGLLIATRLWRFWLACGRLTEARRCFTSLLVEVGETVPADVRAGASFALGALAYRQSDTREALERWNDALRYYRERDDPVWLATVLNAIGAARTELGEYAAAETLFDEAAGIRRRVGDHHGLAVTMNNMANVVRYRGALEVAAAYYEESLALYDAVGVTASKASTMNNLAIVALELGDLDRAEALSRESLSIPVETASFQLRGKCLVNLADVALEREQYDEARSLYEEGMREYLDEGNTGSAAGAAIGLGQLALALGNADDAERWAERAAELQGEWDKRGSLELGLLRGDALFIRGALHAAEVQYREVLRNACGQNLALFSAQALERLGWMAAVREEWHDVVLRCSAADTLRARTSGTWTRMEAAQHAHAISAAIAAIDDVCVQEVVQQAVSARDTVLTKYLASRAEVTSER